MILACFLWCWGLAAAAQGVPDGGYRVGAQDELAIEVYGEPELSVIASVNESCQVSLALVGSISVCGMTPSEIADEISQRYADGYLVNASASVHVEEYRSQRVDVLGEVETRGPIYLRGPTSIVEVVSMAGGPRADNVVRLEVVRASGDKENYDFAELTGRAEPVMARAGDKLVLKPGEIVYVEGEIRNPGAITLSDALTVTQALARAGGPDDFANLRRVLVRRADGSSVRVNVVRVHRGAEEDVEVFANDHILVPRGGF